MIAVLIVMAASAAPAADSKQTAALRGIVLDAMTGEPVPFTTVTDTVSRRGTMTDGRGRFLIDGLPVRVTIRIIAIGMESLYETFDLSPSDTVQRTFQLTGPTFQRFQAIRDSLSRIGRWPPTLDPDLLVSMREAIDVRVFRLDPHHPALDRSPDPVHHIGPWPILREARKPVRSVVRQLVETLRHSELYMANLRSVQKLCGGFQPGIDVRFTHHGIATDVLLCYACGEFAIWNDGRHRMSGDFDEHEAAFARFAKRTFPDEPLFKQLDVKPRTPPGSANHKTNRAY